MNCCFDELFPGLQDQLSREIKLRNSRLLRFADRIYCDNLGGYRYANKGKSDSTYEQDLAEEWLMSATCMQTIDGPGLEKSLELMGEDFASSSFVSLSDLNLTTIHDSGTDYHTSWACNELHRFIANNHHHRLGQINNATRGLLIIHGICNGDTLAYLIDALCPRLILIFEQNLDIIPEVVSELGAHATLSALKRQSSSLYLISDREPDAAYIKARGLIEAVNLFCQERLFILSFRSDEVNQRISERFYQGGTMLKDLRLLGFFVDELHMMMNAAITMSQLPPRIIDFESVQPHSCHAVVAASGPSLKCMHEKLVHARDKYHLFSCYSTLRSLLMANIIPDYHCNQERHACHIPLLSDVTCKSAIRDMPLLCSANNDPRMNALYSECIAYFRSASATSALFGKGLNECMRGEGTQVINLAINYAVLLGYRTIHLVGADLGVTSHEETRDANALFHDAREYNIKAAGNLRDCVWTNESLIEVADFVGMLLNGTLAKDSRPVPDLKVFNYSDGLRIPNTIPVDPDSFPARLMSADTRANKTVRELIELIPRLDQNWARSRWIGYDWRKRIDDYTSILRELVEEPFNQDNLEFHLQAAERQFQDLPNQVLTRMMAGTISRIWYFIIMTDSRLPQLSNSERESWSLEASRILTEVIDSMEQLSLEMVAYVEGLECVHDHVLASTLS